MFYLGNKIFNKVVKHNKQGTNNFIVILSNRHPVKFILFFFIGFFYSWIFHQFKRFSQIPAAWIRIHSIFDKFIVNIILIFVLCVRVYPSSENSMKSFQLQFQAHFHMLVGPAWSSKVNFTEILPSWRNANSFKFSFTQQENMLRIYWTIVLSMFSVILV